MSKTLLIGPCFHTLNTYPSLKVGFLNKEEHFLEWGPLKYGEKISKESATLVFHTQDWTLVQTHQIQTFVLHQ
jgi:hypothetical protein